MLNGYSYWNTLPFSHTQPCRLTIFLNGNFHSFFFVCLFVCTDYSMSSMIKYLLKLFSQNRGPFTSSAHLKATFVWWEWRQIFIHSLCLSVSPQGKHSHVNHTNITMSFGLIVWIWCLYSGWVVSSWIGFGLQWSMLCPVLWYISLMIFTCIFCIYFMSINNVSFYHYADDMQLYLS